jgi:hypothetical protein
MIAKQISVSQCAAFAGLSANELVLGVAPSAKHVKLFSNYLRNLGNDRKAVQEVIVAAIRAYIEMGAMKPAADLFIVLRMLLSEQSDGELAAEASAPIVLAIEKCRPRSRPLERLGAARKPHATSGDVLSLSDYRRQRFGSATVA